MLLSEAIEELAIATRANGRRPRTVQSYVQKLRPLVEYLGDVAVDSITVRELRRYSADLMDRRTLYAGHPSHPQRDAHLSPFTVASRVRAVRRLFNFLEEEGLIQANPMRKIRTPQPKRTGPKGISQDDFVALLDTTEGGSLTDNRDRAVLFFLRDTGCRAGGICGLRVRDVDLERRVAVLVEKGEKRRVAPFTAMTAKVLATWLDVRPSGKGETFFVGLGNRSHDAMSPNSLAKMLAIRGKKAGVTGPVNPHSFRHAFARDYLMSGGDLGSLADLLGHTNVLVTKMYYGLFTTEQLQEKHARHSPVAQMSGDASGAARP